ncbi:MAG: tyrosine recombinase XerC [Patescibacteria group bacterium]|nr:MAG: tyrosine recombinase XerC [Patescibacteria group bacterium]
MIPETPAKILDKFIKTLQEQGKSNFTIIAYKKDLEQFIGFLTKKEIEDVREVKKTHIEEFINELINNNYTKKSASRKLNSIRTFFKFLKNEGIITYNPALDVAHPKQKINPPRILSKLEYMALRDYAKKDTRTYAMVELILQTGLKIGELANIHLDDIKENTLIIKKYGTTPEREIPLTEPAKKAIEEYLKVRPQTKDTHLFVTRKGTPLLIRNIRQIISRCFDDVGIENATVNDLRNTFIAHQLSNGASIEYVAQIVGHKRLSSTERFLSHVKPAVDKKTRIFEL